MKLEFWFQVSSISESSGKKNKFVCFGFKESNSELNSTIEYGSYEETTPFVIDYGDYEDGYRGYLIMKCEE